ncbi:MAG: NAD(P)-dependent oxidoreductase [Desulfuromonadaceae bacterium]|nr:NAD(P)-dependent oxidoreductase [Desulfuromonas sp.]MDY0185694.1 NAD(P)-dependent oxidoreductase [Desulfuromonadaceae bacterium]
MAHYGFIGSGLMGLPMATNLLKAGHQLTVWNRSKEKCAPLLEAGATFVDTPLEVVIAAEVTFSMLADPQAALAVCFSPSGVIQAVAPGKAYVEMSTIDPETSSKIGISIQARGALFLEAPVSGSVPQAEAGELVIMCAGDHELYVALEEALNILGKKHLYLGEVGAAASMKLGVNQLMGSMMASFCEVLTLLEEAGLDAQDFLDIIGAGALAAPMFTAKGKKILARDRTPQFPLKHQQKDLRLALQLGDVHRVPMPVAAAANELFKRAYQYGLEDDDVSALFVSLHPAGRKPIM